MMPDQFGRITGDDWMGMARAASAMFGNDNTKVRHARDEMIDQYGNVKSAVEAVNPDELNPHQLKAFSSMQKDYTGAVSAKRESDINAAVQGYHSQWQESGGDLNKLSFPKTDVEMAAQQQFFDAVSKTQEGRKALDANRKARIQQQYGEFRPHALKATELIKSGNIEAARPHIEAASNSAPIPYRYRFDDGTGFYVEEFRSDSTGKWEPTRHVTEEEAVQALTQIMQGEQVTGSGELVNPYFFQEAYRRNEATRQGNLANLSDQKQWLTMKGKDGKVYHAIPQNSLADHNRPTDYILRDAQGNIIKNKRQAESFIDPHSSTPKVQTGSPNMFSMEELNSMGLMPENLEREQNLANISKTNQQTATSQAQQKSHEASAAATTATMPMKIEKAQVDLESAKAKYNKTMQDIDKGNLNAARQSLDDLLMPFKTKGGSAINFETGEISSGGNNALNDARDYIKDAEAGKEHDPAVLAQAQMAVTLYGKLAGQHSSKYNLQTPEGVAAMKDSYARLVQSYMSKGMDKATAKSKAQKAILKGNPQYRGVLTGSKQTAMKPH